jgi:hypothetical protein
LLRRLILINIPVISDYLVDIIRLIELKKVRKEKRPPAFFLIAALRQPPEGRRGTARGPAAAGKRIKEGDGYGDGRGEVGDGEDEPGADIADADAVDHGDGDVPGVSFDGEGADVAEEVAEGDHGRRVMTAILRIAGLQSTIGATRAALMKMKT